MTRSSLSNSLEVQIRVIGALTLREVLTRYGRKNIGFLWLFIEPMIFVTIISLLWTLIKESQNFQMPIIAFAVTGYSSVLLWRNMVNRCSGAMSPNIGLLFHRNVKVLDVFSARILLEFAGATISFFLLTLILISFDFILPPDDLLKVFAGWFMLTWFGASLALVVGSLSEKSDMVDKIWHPLSFLLMPLSGLAFMVDWLSPEIREYALYIPMVHGLELIRDGFFGNIVRAHYDMSYLAIVCLCLSFFGLSLSRDVSRRINPQ